MYDADDIVEVKKRSKRRRRRKKFLIFMLVFAVISGLWYTRDEWLPKLRGIGKKYQIVKNDGELAEGNFPIEITGGAEYQLQCSDDTLLLLSDANIYYYSEDGVKLKRRQHVYTNSVLDASNGNALIYESGGDEFSVENEDEILYSKSFDNPIMFAELSAEGYTAVVTSSETYACELDVYNDSGKLIYERECVERISDLAFTGESSGCVISYIDAKNGALVTTVQKVSFNSTEDKWKSPEIDTLGLQVFGSDGGAFVLGYESCAFVDSSGQISSYYEYSGDFAGGDCKSGKAAVIINDDDMRKYTLALFNGNDEVPVTIESENPLKYVLIYDGLAYVMDKDEIRAYDFSGKLRSTAEVTDSYNEFRRSSDYVFLMAYNRIDRIDYNS